MNKKGFGAGLLAVALLIPPLASWAQDDDRNTLSDVWLIVPKQGMVQQFEAAAKTHLAYRRDAGDSRTWTAYQTSVGANPTLYQWRANGLDWADQDAYVAEDADNGYSAHWFANVDQYVDHYHHFMEVADLESSNWPADLGQHPYYGVTSWTMKPNAGPDVTAARKELSRLAKEEGWAERGNHWIWLSRVGGRPTLMIATEFDDYADMAPPEQSFFAFVSEQIGAEEARALIDRFTAGFADSNYAVWAHRPDLSSSAEMVGSTN